MQDRLEAALKQLRRLAFTENRALADAVIALLEDRIESKQATQAVAAIFVSQAERPLTKYERFTDRARKVMQLANQEAMRFNHEYIGTEHILLGLSKEGGIASQVLEQLGADMRAIRLGVEALVQQGPEVISMGKLPQTPRTKKVIELAQEESASMGHNWTGSEHILLGCLREPEGVACRVLNDCGVTLENARAACLEILGAPHKEEAKQESWRDRTPFL